MALNPKILILIDWYLPGYRAGGPIQSAANLVAAMKDVYDFTVITLNKDHASEEEYKGIEPNCWVERPEGVRIFYFSENALTYAALQSKINEINPDFVYLNTLFSPRFSIWPLLMKKKNKIASELILAPRGSLHQKTMSSLSLKTIKKKAFIAVMKLLAIHKKMTWQATNAQEKRDIERFFGEDIDIRMAQNFPRQRQKPWKEVSKAAGNLRVLIQSRVAPEKNLAFFFELLGGFEKSNKVEVVVYGAQQDPEYLEKCQELIRAQRANIELKGSLPPAELMEAIEDFHVSVLPSHGENFGHAIFEGMLAGKPVLISDKTPWQELEKKSVGWVLPLTNKQPWLEILKKLLDMEQEEWNKWSRSAWNYAKSYKESSATREQNVLLFSKN